MSNETDQAVEKGKEGFLSKLPSMLSKNSVLLALIAFLYLLPLVTSAENSPMRDLLSVMTKMMILGLLAMSFDLQLGRAGLLNFGQVALFGVGAFFAAFTLNFTVFGALDWMYHVYFATLIVSMLLGAGLGFIMGLTTSRMRGTAFAFIALAIAMFLYNFFAESPDISGGETGLQVRTPGMMLSAPYYLFFVAVAFVVLALFFGMMVLYVRKRTESIGPLFYGSVVLAFLGVLVFFGANIIGAILIAGALVAMTALYLMERRNTVHSPLEFEAGGASERPKGHSPLTSMVLPILAIVLAVGGVLAGFGGNILNLATTGETFYFRIPVMYYLVLSCVVVVYVFVKRLVASPFGRMVAAVAQNEERAEALGYNSYLTKIVVVVISGAIAGLAGALYAPFLRTIDPTSALGVEVSIDAMLYTIIGGLGTLFGPLLGSGVVSYSEANLVDLLGEWWIVGLGTIYIIIVLFLPLGIVGSASVKSRSLKERLQRVKIGDIEFGIKGSDYWTFALLGMMSLVLLMLFIITL